MEATDEKIAEQISNCIELLREVLKSDLLGVYLYGSYLLGGLQKYSDIDLFAVSKRETSLEEKALLEKELLKISGIYNVSNDLKPIEIIIVTKSAVNPWKYPPDYDYPKFDFLYGDWLRKDFEAGSIEPWPNNKKMPNLALIITQLLLSNKVLYGPKPDELLNAIPYKDFVTGTTAEIGFLMNEIDWDTRNILLTLARIWTTLETDTIRSKEAATSWAIEKLPNEFKPVLEYAKAVLLGEKEENWNELKDLINPCAEYMIEKIKAHMEIIKSSDTTDRKIQIA